MTVKRRLYISNILMIVIPVLLFTVMGSIVINAAVSLFGFRDNKDSNAYNEFDNAVSRIKRLSDQWESDSLASKIKEDAAAFGKQYSGRGIALIVFKNGEQFYASGEYSGDAFLQSMLDKTGTHTFVIDDTIIYKRDAGA